jgi:hypothetical protein
MDDIEVAAVVVVINIITAIGLLARNAENNNHVRAVPQRRFGVHPLNRDRDTKG